ncbi:MAG: phytanoyl-CoA dioxygenase family protein [Fimbriimonadaceae bacterium]|jgi:hypothetical protein|nr:phytanoyl-CoA dioxygenase family protein [Fimbriimonadaceae bacterium]
MTVATPEQFKPISGGVELSVEPDRWGHLTISRRDESPDVLRTKFAEDGYLFIKGFFERSMVQAVRQSLLKALSENGKLAKGEAIDDAIPKPGLKTYMDEETGLSNPELRELVHGEQILNFYEAFFEESVLSFDYIWLRSVSPGVGTNPHCDTVYMGRGTDQLMTAWVPLGDVPLTVGGLIVLEKSHETGKVDERYLQSDVDKNCLNMPGTNEVEALGYLSSGALTKDARGLQERLGGRWLTAEFEMGDLVTFGMRTVHGSLDNQSQSLRLSSDTRYQPASLPVDDRWFGPEMTMHGQAGKQEKIC